MFQASVASTSGSTATIDPAALAVHGPRNREEKHRVNQTMFSVPSLPMEKMSTQATPSSA